MQAHVSLGKSLSFSLSQALLIYRQDRKSSASSPAEAFLTQHPVEVSPEGIPSLGPGTLLDRSFLQTLITELQGTLPVEILPENVLLRTPDRLCWWTSAGMRPMFYRADRSPELSELSGHRFPQPALLFEVRNRSLRIRALSENRRPGAKTQLFRAPYWNVNNGGDVCLGSTRAPKELTVASMSRWEASFFESEFTHANSVKRLTEHPEGFAALWQEIKGAEAFPACYLSDANQTLEQFLRA